MSMNRNFYIVFNKMGERVGQFSMSDRIAAHDFAKRIGGYVRSNY